jgi:two-component system sensor histidine kinase PilS (NtrC family)
VSHIDPSTLDLLAAPRADEPDSAPADPQPRTGNGRYPAGTALAWLLLARLLLVGGLVLVFSPASTDPLVATADLPTVWRVLLVYAILVLASGLNLYARWPSRENQVYLAVFVDILAFTFLMHAAGGVSSGLGALIALSVAAGALLMEGRLSLLFAAIATLAVIAEQTYSQLQGDAPASVFTQAGLLGVMFFAVALLAHVLYRRVRDVEALAARRKVDIDDLSKLNAFIIQAMGTGVVVVDGERHLRLMNQAARDLLDAALAEPGMGLKTISPDLSDWLDGHVRPEAVQGQVTEIGGREIRPSRELLGDFRAAGVLIFLRDHQELLKEAQQMKMASLGTLTASIAHNIRNPLGAISHAAQLLAESEVLGEDDRHLLDIVRRNSARIDEIVRSILQLSRRDRMESRTLELASWAQELCQELNESQGLVAGRLVLQSDPAPIQVEADPRHLHQIVANLCENALIHGVRPGEPALVRVLVSRGDGQGRAVLEVEDEGPGIDAATAREMFSPFFTTKASGTGLGLYIARELAETNGIRLLYERRLPQGSRFRLVFGA